MQPGRQYEDANQKRAPSLPTSARAVPLQLHQSAKLEWQDVSWIWRGVQDLDGVQPQALMRANAIEILMKPGDPETHPGTEVEVQVGIR